MRRIKTEDIIHDHYLKGQGRKRNLQNGYKNSKAVRRIEENRAGEQWLRLAMAEQKAV